MKEILLQGKGLYKTFAQGGESIAVLDHIDTEIDARDFTVIMGPSGAGKSTRLYVLSGMDPATGGEITYKGKCISGFSEAQMAALRSREFGFVFQQTHLISNLTLYENILVAGFAGTAFCILRMESSCPSSRCPLMTETT